MEWMLREDRRPGDGINEAELARAAGVSTSGIREYLNRFSRFGLIEKRQNSGWLFRGFTQEFALELFEVRELFETRSAIAFATQPRDAPAWKTLAGLEIEHRAAAPGDGPRATTTSPTSTNASTGWSTTPRTTVSSSISTT